MKNLFAVGLLCLAASACSTNYAGGFKGETEVHTFQDSYAAGAKDAADNDVIALVTPKGKGGTLEFSDTDDIGECKLKLDSLGEQPAYVQGQVCEVWFNGSMERFAVNGISFKYADSTETMFITVQGWNAGSAYGSGGKHFFQINFKGKPYANK